MFDHDKALKIISAFQDLLDKTPTEIAHTRISPDSWTLTEIVGHLVDSSSNNHQRFARLQAGDLKGFPAYEAEPWVEVQKYDEFDFEHIAQLWTSYNRFLLHLITATPQDKIKNKWVTAETSMSLDFLMTDYYDHMNLHVAHYRERLLEVME